MMYNSTILKKTPDFTSKTNPLMIHVQYILINYTLLLSKCPYEQQQKKSQEP